MHRCLQNKRVDKRQDLLIFFPGFIEVNYEVTQLLIPLN